MNKVNAICAVLSLSLATTACPTRPIQRFDAGSGGSTDSNGGVGGTGGSAAGAAGGGRTALDGSLENPDASSLDSRSAASPGSILWARSASSVFLTGVVEGSTGVEVSGILSAPASLGGPILTPVGSRDGALAEFGASDGSYLFSSRFGGGSPEGTGGIFAGISALSMGSPLITGTSECDPGGSPACNEIDAGLGLQAPGGGSGTDGFIGLYSVNNGSATWVDRLVGPGNDHVISVAAGANGQIFAAGWYDQSTVLYAGANAYQIDGAGDRDILIAEVAAASGAIGMTKTFATPSFEEPQSIAWTGSEIVVSGTFSGSTVLGSRTLISAGDFDLWIAKLRPSDLTPVWAVSLGGPARDRYPFMTVDSVGDIYIAANITGPFTLGSKTVGTAGGVDILVAKLSNADGHVMWATSLGSAGDDGASGIAVDSTGRLIVGGNAAGPLELGGPTYGNGDALIAAYSGDDGTARWTKVVGTSGTDYGVAVAAGTDAFYAAVDLGGNVASTIEGVSIEGAPNPIGLLLKIQP